MVLLLWLGLIGFSRVRVRVSVSIMVRFSFSDGLPYVE